MIRSCSTLFVLFLLSNLSISQNIDSLIQNGNKLRAIGNPDLAIVEYKKALTINKKSSETNYEMAYTYQILNDFENTIKYCNRTIRARSTKVIEAYILKGSALDYLGKQKKSTRLYCQAIKKHPNNYLLQYNLGITYHNRNKLAKAETQYIKSIEIDKLQPSSHYMLGILMNDSGNRVKSMLSLYFFLLLEPNTERSVEALELLTSLWKKNVEVNPLNPGSEIITYNSNKENINFNSIDLAISSIYARNSRLNKQKQNDYEFFISNTLSLFSLLYNYKDTTNQGPWETLYAKIFKDLASANLVEPFCYYISSSKDDIVINTWLESSKEKIDSFSNWINQRLKEK